jgi:outer membrane protein
VERLRKLVNAGAVAEGDLFNIEAQKAIESSAAVDARNSLELATLTLVQMLDLPTTQGFDIEMPDLELGQQPTLIANPDQIFGYALETQPSIKSAESRLKSSEYNLMIARGTQSPQLTLQGSIGTGYSGAAQILDTLILTGRELIGFTLNPDGQPLDMVYSYSYDPRFMVKPFNDQINDNINKSIAFNLSIPIFNGWSTRTAISKARINLENSKYNLEASKLDLRKTIQQAYADAKAALNKYNSSVAGVSAARESFRYAEQKFNVGMINSVDYNNSKKDLDKAESELLRAKYEFIFKTTVLDFYMGKPISLKRK